MAETSAKVKVVRRSDLVPLSPAEERFIAPHLDRFGLMWQHIDPSTIPPYVKELYERKQAIKAQAMGTVPPRKPPVKVVTASSPDPQRRNWAILLAVDFHTVLIGVVIGLVLVAPVVVYAIVH